MQGKVLVVSSFVQGNGAKYVAVNLAFDLVKNKSNNKVLLLDFDFDYPHLAERYIPSDTMRGLDNLVTYVQGDKLTEDSFLQEVIETKIGVDVLKGTKYPGKGREFTVEQIKAILSIAKECYDYVIVVVGRKPDNAGTVVSCMMADHVLCVVRDNYSNVSQAKTILRGLHHYTSNEHILIVYNYLEDQAESNLVEVLESESVHVVGALRYDPKSIDNQNLEKKDSLFNKSLNAKEFTKINQMIWK